MRLTCEECGKEFIPWRDRIFDRENHTCGSDDCQRKRKTRLQKKRRAEKRAADPRRRHAGPGYSGYKMDNLAAAARHRIRTAQSSSSELRPSVKQRRS